jgi:hypothetical protein
MNKNIGTYTIHREQNKFGWASVHCNNLFSEPAIIISANNANEQAEKINQAIRIFEEKLATKNNQ